MFPADLPVLTNPTGANNLDDPGVLHSAQHANANDLIEALAAKLGVDGSAVATSIDYLVKAAADPGHTHTLYVPKTVLDAFSVLGADTNDTPMAVPLAASTVVGRKASGGVVAVTMAELRALLGTGTQDATTYLRGDGTWTAPPGGGLAVEEDGTEEGTGIERLNFGTGLNVAVAGTEATITAEAASGSVHKETILHDQGAKTTTSTTFTAIDATNLGYLTLDLATGDVVECLLVGTQDILSGAGFVSYDFEVDRPTSANHRVYETSASGAGSQYGGFLMAVNVAALYIAGEAGVHGFRPVWKTSTSTARLKNNSGGGVEETAIMFSVRNLGPATA